MLVFWDGGACTEKLIAVHQQNDRDLESEALNLTPNSAVFTVRSWASGLTSLGQMLIVSKWVVAV